MVGILLGGADGLIALVGIVGVFFLTAAIGDIVNAGAVLGFGQFPFQVSQIRG